MIIISPSLTLLLQLGLYKIIPWQKFLEATKKYYFQKTPIWRFFFHFIKTRNASLTKKKQKTLDTDSNRWAKEGGIIIIYTFILLCLPASGGLYLIQHS